MLWNSQWIKTIKVYILLHYVSTAGQLQPHLICLLLPKGSGLICVECITVIPIFQLKKSSLMLILCVLAGRKKKVQWQNYMMAVRVLARMWQYHSQVAWESLASSMVKLMPIEHGTRTSYREGNISLRIVTECTTGHMIHLTATAPYECWWGTKIEIRELWSRNHRINSCIGIASASFLYLQRTGKGMYENTLARPDTNAQSHTGVGNQQSLKTEFRCLPESLIGCQLG